MNKIWDRKRLAQFLRESLKEYNKRHPKQPFDYEILLSRATAYMTAKHPSYNKPVKHDASSKVTEAPVLPNTPMRYQYLGLRFDKTFKPVLPGNYQKLYDAFNKKYSNSIDDKFISFNSSDDLDDALDIQDSAFEAYMEGNYFFDEKENVYKIHCEYESFYEDDLVSAVFKITQPDFLFYAIARVLLIPEKVIIQVFQDTDGLDIRAYNQLYVYDVLDYYYQKSSIAASTLSKLINAKGFGSSMIAYLMNGTQPISYEQFNMVAPHLDIPDKLFASCQSRLAQNSNDFAFKEGYSYAYDDFKDHPDEMRQLTGMFLVDADYIEGLERQVDDSQQAIATYESFFSQPGGQPLHEYYLGLGYNIHIVDDDLIEITMPSGDVKEISAKQYMTLIDSFRQKAEESLLDIIK